MRDTDDGLAEFLAPPSASAATLANAEAQSSADETARRILKDLVPSSKRLAAAYVAFTAVGYGLSLALCAQNGVGLFAFSHSMAHSMHAIPWPWCPAVCGALFALIPNLFARAFLTRFQQRYLVLRLGWLLALAPIAASAAVALASGNEPQWLWLGLWTLGALGTAALLEWSFAAWLFRFQRAAQ